MDSQPDKRNSFSLKSEELVRLRRIVENMSGEVKSVPHAEALALAREHGLEAGITIDVEASLTLGSPLVILRPVAHKPTTNQLSMLSPRETSVAALIAVGASNKEIARSLSISIATAKDHVHHILEKTGLPNRAAVAAEYSRALA